MEDTREIYFTTVENPAPVGSYVWDEQGAKCVNKRVLCRRCLRKTKDTSFGPILWVERMYEEGLKEKCAKCGCEVRAEFEKPRVAAWYEITEKGIRWVNL